MLSGSCRVLEMSPACGHGLVNSTSRQRPQSAFATRPQDVCASSGGVNTKAPQSQSTRAPMKGDTFSANPLTREECYSNFSQTKQLSEPGPPMLRRSLDPCISARLRSASSTLGGRVHLMMNFEVALRGLSTCVAFVFARLILRRLW